jgi:hypothetical protein
MGRGLGPFQCEVLQRIGKHLAMFGDAKVGDIAKEMALARGLVALVVDGMGTEHTLDVAHAIGLRRALAILERRGLVTRYPGGRIELTEAGVAAVGERPPISKEEIATDHTARQQTHSSTGAKPPSAQDA